VFTGNSTSSKEHSPLDANRSKRVVLGVGNILLSDEGVGIHAVRRLEDTDVPPEVELYDGGTEGFGLMDLIVGLDRLVVVDCVRGGEAPGTIYCFEIEDLATSVDKYQTSIHQVGILEILHLVELVGKRPRTTIVGVEPESLAIGMELSPAVSDRLASVTRLTLAKVLED